jgi:hypothetical protein
MTKTRVTRIVRIVFVFWLVVAIAVVLATIVTLVPLSGQGRGHEATDTSHSLLANGDRQPQCFPAAWQRLPESLRGDWPWLLRLTSTVLTLRCAVSGPALNLSDLQRPQFGMRLACPMVERKTPC